uniref:Peroxidase n=1 Tax=Marchantia polymorpha TaxID=3197 RepID=Q8H958_MARPO|nr:peroxidase 1 [Marchantia polymorpha]
MTGKFAGSGAGLCIFVVVLALFVSQAPSVDAQLDQNYYVGTCPNVENLVNQWLVANVFTDPTGPAALVRLVFHDCQVNGCDGSVLLDTQPGAVSELESDANFGIRDLRFIDSIKAAVELACPGVVSCTDILALAARDCVRLTGGPSIRIPLGRKDGRSASNLAADRQLPPSDISVPAFLSEFAQMGMTADEAVAIIGAHTIGVGHCVNVVNRLFPQQDPALSPLMAGQLLTQCPTPNAAFLNNNTILSNDFTNFVFDNQYYRDVMNGNGLFKIDSLIGQNPTTAGIVARFAANQNDFFGVFSRAFVKMTSFRVLTGAQGEVRRNCHRLN